MKQRRYSGLSWLTWLMMIVVVASAIGTTALWVKLGTTKDQFGAKIELLEKEVSKKKPDAAGDEFLDYYRDINAKMDQAIDRIIAIVEVTVTTMLVFGFLLAYKAPRDVERELERLRSETESAKESAEEARYQALICVAESRDSAHDRILRYDELISKYPSRPDAYNARGSVYDEIGKYDRAIHDYEAAFKRGGEEEIYLNNVAVCFAKAGHHDVAESFYTRAIERCPNNAHLYANRAVVRGDLGAYEESLADFEMALSLDSGDPITYTNRAITYQEMARDCQDDDERHGLWVSAVNDLVVARELDPQDERVSNILEKMLRDHSDSIENKQDVQNGIEQIAFIERRLANEVLARGEGLELALPHFEKSLEAKAFTMLDADDTPDSDAVIQALENDPVVAETVEAVTGLESIGSSIKLKLNPLLSGLLHRAGFRAYLSGEWLRAERLFALLAFSENPSDNMALTNLAYMRRRGETSETQEEAVELLDLCRGSRDAIWAMNMALCYADGVGVEQSMARFVDLLRAKPSGVKDSFNWWKDESVVGQKESNLALLGLGLAGYTCLGDSIPVSERMDRAREDGYTFDEL